MRIEMSRSLLIQPVYTGRHEKPTTKAKPLKWPNPPLEVKYGNQNNFAI